MFAGSLRGSSCPSGTPTIWSALSSPYILAMASLHSARYELGVDQVDLFVGGKSDVDGIADLTAPDAFGRLLDERPIALFTRFGRGGEGGGRVRRRNGGSVMVR